eukprot:SAG31_NODE_1030_length_10250_cov_2.791942_5_plen_1292_part_00
MGLIAEPPKMQPLDQDRHAFSKLQTNQITPRVSRCSSCPIRSSTDADDSGTVGPFESKEVLLLGQEGVPMLGCWCIDVEFEYSPANLAHDHIAFHCLAKSYAGDAIMARTFATQGTLIVFVAPKAVFVEETETMKKLSQYFESLEKEQHLAEIPFHEGEGPRCWYRLLILAQPAPTLTSEDRTREQTYSDRDDWDTLNLTEKTPHQVETKPLLGIPASQGQHTRTPQPMPSPRRTPHSRTPRMRHRQRRGSLTEIVAPGSSTPTNGNRSRRLSVQVNFSPLKTTPKASRTKSRRLSIMSMQSSESDGWSDDEDGDRAISLSPTVQKLLVTLTRCGRDEQITSFVYEHEWQGHINFSDCYTLGNVYDEVCGRAHEDLNWSIGRLRNFRLHGLDHDFTAAVAAMPSRGHIWLLRAICAAAANSDGRLMQAAAVDMGINITRRDDDEHLIRQSSRNLLRGVSGILHPMRTSSSRHFPTSPFGQSPRTPRGVQPSPFRSPSPSPAPVPSELRPRSSYRTLADKLMNSKADLAAENNNVIDTVETQNQPPGTLLWIKYQLTSVGCLLQCDEICDSKTRRVERPGLVWKNKWEIDMSPGFPWSTDIIYREDLGFMQDKARRTQRLIRAAFKALTDDFVKGEQYWRIDGNNPDSRDLLIDGAKFFFVRGDIARRDSGLNSMFSGQQVKHARRAVQRIQRVNTSLLNSVIALFLFPPWELFRMLRHGCCCGRLKGDSGKSSLKSSSPATKTLLTYIFRHRRYFPRAQVLAATGTVWLGCVLPFLAYILSNGSNEHTHGIEIFVNIVYYLWAAFSVATTVCSEVRGVKGHVTYAQAALKSEISSKSCTLTKIVDGITVTTSAMAIVQMVCRKHLGEDEEEEEEEEEEENGMDLSLKLLRWFWQQDSPSAVLPWLADQMQHDEELCSMSDGALNRLLVFEFQMKDPPRDKNDWKFNLNIAMQGIQSELDLGRTNWKGRLFVGMLATLHASLGMLHRTMFRKQAAFGQSLVDFMATTAAMSCSVVSSYVVYSYLFDIGLTWWMVFKFLKQTHSVIIVEEAIRDKLPCYMDLRTAGNLGSWYTARCYLQMECENLCFAHKDQLPIAIALVFCAGLSVNALTNYFSAESQVDFAQNPGILITLYNLVTVGALLMVAMLALEKINMETSVLLRKMNQVAVELGKSLEDSVYSRLSDDDRTNLLADLRNRVAAARHVMGSTPEGVSTGQPSALCARVNATGTCFRPVDAAVDFSQHPSKTTFVATGGLAQRIIDGGRGNATAGLSPAESAERLLELDSMVMELQVL